MFSDVTSESLSRGKRYLVSLLFHEDIWCFKGKCLMQAVSASVDIGLGVLPACGGAAGGPGVGPRWARSWGGHFSDWTVALEKRRALCGVLLASPLRLWQT